MYAYFAAADVKSSTSAVEGVAVLFATAAVPLVSLASILSLLVAALETPQ